MTFQLDEATLAAITQEVRQCFLEQDAPEYMEMLENGLQNRDGDLKSLLRAAHSLKGGAGVAQLSSLKELSHQLEDILQLLEKGELQDVEMAWMLLEKGVNEIAFLLNQARAGHEAPADPDLIETLGTFHQLQQIEVETAQTLGTSTSKTLGAHGHTNSSFISSSLQQDLENSFLRVEELPSDATEEVIMDCLESFFDECLFLGETLDLTWLVEGIAPLEAVLDEADSNQAFTLALDVISLLRQQRDRYLVALSARATTDADRIPPIVREIREGPEGKEEQEVEGLESNKELPDLEVAAVDTSLSHLRVPLKRLENITNSVEELILTQERIRLQQQQLAEANLRLRKLASQFEPIREQVQSFYDQLAISPVALGNVNPIFSLPSLGGMDDSPVLEFDSLELDRFTTLHSSLQNFQELMLRVKEVRADLDLIHLELEEGLEEVDKNLDGLYGNVTQSRLVPFRLLAQRFLPQMENLNRRYPEKSVHFQIEGEDVLVDQLLLEQLQTPLTHLLNNAFDHGIEVKALRVQQQKAETASIVLKATMEQNQLLITITDDGGGINLEKIYRLGLERGLCDLDRSMDQLSEEEILQWIFNPDFSTAEQVSQLSGRGMGLDIVRGLVQRLRGTIKVQTKQSRGTVFILRFPPTLSLLSLLLVQIKGRIVAIPATSIRETLLLSELQWLEGKPPMANWHQQAVPVVPLSTILSRSGMGTELTELKIGLVLDCAFGPLLVTVDALVDERQLIVKPFDDTVMTPPYLAGCTILGSGEVVPVLLPQALAKPAEELPSHRQPETEARESKVTTILVAEDSVATRRLLERLLTQMGCNSLVCRDGQEALDTLQEHQGEVDLVISDIEMPRLNGFELLYLVRSRPQWQHLPVVILTSRTGDRHRQEAMQRGANAYLGKPVQPQELLSTIQPLLKQNVSALV